MFVRVLRALPRLVSKVALKTAAPLLGSTRPLLLHASVRASRDALSILRR
jgi:hypothetical protein